MNPPNLLSKLVEIRGLAKQAFIKAHEMRSLHIIGTNFRYADDAWKDLFKAAVSLESQLDKLIEEHTHA